MKNLKVILAALTIFTFLFTACKSPEKLLENGNYDYTIDRSIRKIAGKKKKDPVYVAALEEAFERATKADMRRIETLKREGSGNYWVKVHDIENGIARRQNKISPLLPLQDKRGYQAAFSFVRIDEMLTESRQNAAEFYYVRGNSFMNAARNGDKNAARSAYQILAKTKKYFDNYKDRANLMKEAHDLGIVHIIYTTENRAGTTLPYGFDQEIKNVSVRDFNTFWKTYYSKPVRGVVMDYRVVMSVEEIRAGREEYREREYVDLKEIKDGFTYVLDNNGNVLKDTLGNDIKVDRFVTISASVLETYQYKNALVKGRLEYFDARTNERTYSDAIVAEAVFDNYAATFRGDRRALSNESRRHIGNSPRPFPTDSQLIMTAARKMRPAIKSKMANRDLTPRIAVVAGN